VKRAIWWIRRDLRLTDNQALNGALEAAGDVLPVFILDSRLLASAYVGEKRLAFLMGGLHALDADLHLRGSYLIVLQGDPLFELDRFLKKSDAQVVYAEPDYSPYASWRDERIAKQLPVHWVGSPAFHPPGTVLKASGEPYTVFTPFRKAWKALPVPTKGMVFKAPEVISTPPGIETIPLPEIPVKVSSLPFLPGEAEAQRRLESFIQTLFGESDPDIPRIEQYASRRDRIDLEYTSGLSPYLRFGMISIRQAVVAAMGAIQNTPDIETLRNVETWLGELIWRDFYIHIIFHFPRVRQENFRLPHVRWENNSDEFTAWREGCTGYPVVDAAMRQLMQSGWMHNRARMITASFLTKDLLVDWRWGERWFMQHLVDGDPAANNGGWQWSAGTGTDAAPYFRIFNPITQGKKYDPDGRHLRRWLPELTRVPDEFIHKPWTMPAEMQKAAGCIIGVDYPGPIVDHAWARERALRAYGK